MRHNVYCSQCGCNWRVQADDDDDEGEDTLAIQSPSDAVAADVDDVETDERHRCSENYRENDAATQLTESHDCQG